MNLADFQNYGWIALLPILFAVILFLQRRNDTKDKRIDDLQEKRLQDAKDSRDQLVEPMKQMTNLTQQIYDTIIRQNNRGA